MRWSGWLSLPSRVRPGDEKRSDGRTRVSAFRQRLTDFSEDRIPDAHVPNPGQALLKVGDQLPIPRYAGPVWQAFTDPATAILQTYDV
jgi:hypothetical protein